MDSLVVIDEQNEYFLRHQKLYFLENVNRINLFIGANNSRKSRFLRKIIEADARIVVSSNQDINRQYIQHLGLAKEIEDTFQGLFNNALMVVNQTKTAPKANRRFYGVDAYFNENKASNDKGIAAKTVVEHLNSINQTLLNVRTGDNATALLKEIRRFHDVVDMLVCLFELRGNMAALSNYLSNSDRWPEENLNSYAFSFHYGTVDGDMSDKLAVLTKARDYFKFLSSVTVSIGSNYLVYIPVLRSARALLMDNGSIVYDDTLKNAVHQQYFEGKLPNKGEAIYTAQHFYDNIQTQKSSRYSSERDSFKAFEEFVGESFFQSSNLEITAVHSKSGTKEIIVDIPNERKDTPIQNLGDGVQAIINLLFPVFTARNESWVFIDEPELNLHPGFQNLFIRTLLENEFLRKKDLRFFINTHSNHILSELLLNSFGEAEIFVFSRKDKDASEIKPFKGYEAATLELLGVLNTSTLISNCSVWVEGITDRLYIRAYLSAYIKHIKGMQLIEGLNYTFIEYSGSNLKHYLFEETGDDTGLNEGINAYFVNNKIFLISDEDFTKNKKHQYYESLKKANFHYEHTLYPEIENLIPAKVLTAFLIDKFKISETAAGAIAGASYRKTKLGKFLTEQFKKHDIKRNVAAPKGGTLNPRYKLLLAEYVLNQSITGKFGWDDFELNEVIADIIPKLYQFILTHNK
jgi:predicted ATPase